MKSSRTESRLATIRARIAAAKERLRAVPSRVVVVRPPKFTEWQDSRTDYDHPANAYTRYRTNLFASEVYIPFSATRAQILLTAAGSIQYTGMGYSNAGGGGGGSLEIVYDVTDLPMLSVWIGPPGSAGGSSGFSGDGYSYEIFGGSSPDYTSVASELPPAFLTSSPGRGGYGSCSENCLNDARLKNLRLIPGNTGQNCADYLIQNWTGDAVALESAGNSNRFVNLRGIGGYPGADDTDLIKPVVSDTRYRLGMGMSNVFAAPGYNDFSHEGCVAILFT